VPDRIAVPPWLERLVGPALIDRVPRDHEQPHREFVRRRVVAVMTLLIGTTLLGLSLATTPGDSVFYPLTASVAVVWVAGGFVSGPLHLGRIMSRSGLRRPLITPLVVGLVAGGVFVLGALVVREIPPLRDFVAHVLAHANQGDFALVSVLALVNGAAEEVFFRGALFAAIGRQHPVLISTVLYALVTIATGNPVLVFAAILMGTVWGLQRRASGGILSSMITHVVWSAIMLFTLPPLFGT
jgi:uncharacterized protein